MYFSVTLSPATCDYSAHGTAGIMPGSRHTLEAHGKSYKLEAYSTFIASTFIASTLTDSTLTRSTYFFTPVL